jgi:Na+/melibiose symporter-like transporter
MSKREVLAYAFGLFGFQAIVGLLNTYQAEFFSYAMAADIAIVGIIVLVARVASAVADPFIGNLIDRTQSKFGKLKPFILYSLAPLVVMTVLIFTPFKGISGVGLYFYIFFMYFIWCMAMTLGDVPSQAIAAVLTPYPAERTKVVSLANTLKSVGFASPAILVPLCTLLLPGGAKFMTGAISEWEYFISAAVIAVLGSALFLLIFFINKERVPYKVEKMSFREMGRALKTNKYLMLVFLSYFLGFGRQAAMGIQAQVAGAILGSPAKILPLGITSALGSMVSMLSVPFLIKKFDERKVYIGMSLYGFIMSTATFIAFYFIGFEGFNMYIILGMMFLMGLQFGCVNIVPVLMVADTVDYYEYKTGKRTEGTAYAVLSFAIKVSLAMGAALGLVIIGLSGYKASIPFEQITKSTKDWVFFAYTAMPGITSLLTALPMFRYDLVGKKKEEIMAALKSRREAAQAENPTTEPADGTLAEYEADISGVDDVKESENGGENVSD